MIRITSDGTAVRSRPTGGLYRYRSINEWLKPILARDEMYFSSKTGLNDPFDLDYGLSVAVNRKVIREKFEHAKRWVETMPEQFRDGYKMFLPYVTQLIPEAFARSEHTYLNWRREHIARGDGFSELRASLKSLADKVGVCCFSTVGDDVLMFSHYADSHRGCCLEFDQFNECNGARTIFPGLVPAVSQPVTYQNTPSVRYFELTLNEMLMTMCYTAYPRPGCRVTTMLLAWRPANARGSANVLTRITPKPACPMQAGGTSGV
jgi:hypothetical protein